MEALVLAMVIATFAQGRLSDFGYALRGKTSPRHKLAMQRLDLERRKLDKGHGRYRRNRRSAFRDYLGLRWADAWAAVGARHTRKHTAREAKRDAIAAGELDRWRDRPGPLRDLARDAAGQVGARYSKALQKLLAERQARREARDQNREQQEQQPVDGDEATEQQTGTEQPPNAAELPVPNLPDFPSGGPVGEDANEQLRDVEVLPIDTEPDLEQERRDRLAADPARAANPALFLPTVAAYCSEEACGGRHDERDEPLRACGNGCAGTQVPYHFHHDADGMVSITSRCSLGCGVESGYSQTWDPPAAWAGLGADDYDESYAEDYPDGYTPPPNQVELNYQRGANDTAGLPHADYLDVLGYIEACEEQGEDEEAAYWKGVRDHHPGNPNRHTHPVHGADRGPVPGEDDGNEPPAPVYEQAPACSWCDRPSTHTQASTAGYPGERDRFELACDAHTDRWLTPLVGAKAHGGVNYRPRPLLTRDQLASSTTTDVRTPTLAAGNHHERNPSMSNTEVVGLTSAITFADQFAAELSGSNGLEQACAALDAGGVNGEVKAEFTSAQEHIAQAIGALERGAEELRSHLSVRDAYAANPSAGSKEFNTAD